MDLTTLTPRATDWTPNRPGRKSSEEGPNPFLENGWLKESYDKGQAYSVTVPGAFEDQQATRNDNGTRVPAFDESGQPVMKSVLTGDAATVVKMLRKAGESLKIGVA